MLHDCFEAITAVLALIALLARLPGLSQLPRKVEPMHHWKPAVGLQGVGLDHVACSGNS